MQILEIIPILNVLSICGLIIATSIVAMHKRKIENNQLELNKKLDHILMVLADLPTRKQASDLLEDKIDPGTTSPKGTSGS